MKKNHKNNYNDPWDRDYYGTGSTNPPKSHGGIIACLLVMVILLGGACSALGILNVRLLQELANAEPEPSTVYLFQDPLASVNEAPTESQGKVPKLGLWSQTVSDFDRRFYDLPRGVLVTDVALDGAAEQAGLRTGDVIVSLEGQRVSDQESLQEALMQLMPGQHVQVDFYRQQTETSHSVTVILSKERA